MPDEARETTMATITNPLLETIQTNASFFLAGWIYKMVTSSLKVSWCF